MNNACTYVTSPCDIRACMGVYSEVHLPTVLCHQMLQQPTAFISGIVCFILSLILVGFKWTASAAAGCC